MAIPFAVQPSIIRLALKRRPLKSPAKIYTSTDIAAVMDKRIGREAQEHFEAIYLSSANDLLAIHEVSIGGMACTQVDPRALFAGALLAGAAAIILCHNHPSGDPTPSTLDVEMTRQIQCGAELLGMRVLDHVIVSHGKHASLSQLGRMDPPARSVLG